MAGYFGAGIARNPDPENLYTMGGSEGLRGFGNNLHPGDAHWILSLEHRWFTEQRWWGLFRVGYVAFVDAGAVQRQNGSGWSQAFPDLGGGCVWAISRVPWHGSWCSRWQCPWRASPAIPAGSSGSATS